MPNYLGRLCKKHPEANGERHSSTYKCVRCQAEQYQRWFRGLKRPTIRLTTDEYEALLARIKELEQRLYGAEQEHES